MRSWGMCEHEVFRAQATVDRPSEAGYAVRLRVECGQCGLVFRFVRFGPRGIKSWPYEMGADESELWAPIEPLVTLEGA